MSAPLLRLVRGFSLVEVVMALGIVTFVLVAILGLLPVGLRQAGDAQEEIRAVTLLSGIAADRITSPATNNSLIYQIAALTPGGGTTSNSFFVKETGESTTNAAEARYRVSATLYPPAANSLNPFYLALRLSWPAGATNATGAVENLTTIPQ